MQLLGRSDMLEVDYKYLQANARICGAHFRDWAFTSSTKERLIRYALPEIGPPPSVFGSEPSTSGSHEAQQTPSSSTEGQNAAKNSNKKEQAPKPSNEGQKTQQSSNEVQQMPQKIIKCSNEVLQILKNSTVVQQSPQNVNVANRTLENSNEAQKPPQNSNVKIILKNSNDVKYLLKNSNKGQQTPENNDVVEESPQDSNKVAKTQNSISEQKGIKRKNIEQDLNPRKNLLQEEKKEETKEETTSRLQQYLKKRKEVLKKLRNTTFTELYPQAKNKMPQSLQNCKKARRSARKNSNDVQQSSSDSSDDERAAPSSNDEEWVPSKSKDVKVPTRLPKGVPLMVKSPNSAKRVPFDAIEAQRIIKNQRCVISKLKKQVEKLKANKLKFVLDLKGTMNPEQYGFVMSQIKQCKRTKEGRRWTKEDKMFALRIFLQSPDAYRILREKLSFPSRATLKKYSKKLDLGV